MVNNTRMVMLGLGIGSTSWLLSRLYGLFASDKALATVTFSTLNVDVSKQISQGVSTDIVSKLLSMLSGGTVKVIPSLLMAIMAGIVLIYIGSWITNFIRSNVKILPTGKKPIGKLVYVLFYGSVVGGLVMGWIGSTLNGLPAIGTALAMIIYYTIVAVVYGFIQQNLIKQLPSLE
jgi:hypothetical protein